LVIKVSNYIGLFLIQVPNTNILELDIVLILDQSNPSHFTVQIHQFTIVDPDSVVVLDSK